MTISNPTVPVLFFVMGMLGFIIAFTILLRRKQRRRETAFYKLVTTLLWVDISGTLGCYPLSIASYINGKRWVGAEYKTCEFFAFLVVFTGQGSSLLITIMAVERYIAIRHPMLHAYYVNSPRSTAVAIVSVGLSVLHASLPFLGLGTYALYPSNTYCSFLIRNPSARDKAFTVIFSVVCCLCLLITNLSNAGALVALLWPRICAKEQETTLRSQQPRVSKAEVNMIILLTGISISLTTCWTPMLVRLFLSHLGSFPPNMSAEVVAIRMTALNQVLDPWIYIILRRDLIIQVMEWFRRLMPIKNSGIISSEKKLDRSIIVLYSSRRSKASSLGESEISAKGGNHGAGDDCACTTRI